MNSEQHLIAKKLFLHAIELKPDKIKPYINSQSKDPEVLKQVFDLIHTYQTNTQHTQDFVSDVAENISRSPLLFPSERYTLIKKIGQGGMGDVYLAQRKIKGIKQKVAIKILQLSDNLSKSRFSQEASILSQLSHPNISQFIDADFLSDGRPYVVMEYAEGKSITEYCQNHNLDIKARLTLFKSLCNAVEHAHRNLIIHRDIKPENILVNKQGKLMLLDFGIAKIIQDTDNHTKTQMYAMTPAYASPEQFMGKPISVASDVYSLGVVLYELLAGKRPHEPKNYSPIEFERLLKETNPTKPSANLSEEAPKNWKSTLSGDLDKITLKSLQFDTSQRYHTIAELIDDLNRYKNNLPVLAHNPSVFYYLGKYLLRNKLLIASIIIFFIFTLFTFQQNIALKKSSKELFFEKEEAIKEYKKTAQLTQLSSETHVHNPENNGKQNLIADGTVNIATGYLYYQQNLDLFIDSINFSLSYNSNYAIKTRKSEAEYLSGYLGRDVFPKYPLGKGWNHSFSRWINTYWLSRKHIAPAFREDGRLILFRIEEEKIITDSNTPEVLTYIESPLKPRHRKKEWSITNSNNSIEYYNRDGNLLNLNKNSTNINFNYLYSNLTTQNFRLKSIDTDSGQHIDFSYANNKIQIIKITNNEGKSWDFDYDLSDNLTTINFPDGSTQLFNYKSTYAYRGVPNMGNLLIGVSHKKQDGQPTQHVSYEYDSKNRVKLIAFYSGSCKNERILITYFNNTRRVTNSQTRVNRYTVEKIKGTWVVVDKDIQFDLKDCYLL